MEHQSTRRQKEITMKLRGFTMTRPNQLRYLILSAILLSLVVFLINPANRQVEAKKLKEKKILKTLVKGLILKNLSTKKNFLPMPVPIPVPIELSEPPVYLKGPPKYVTIYKPAPQPIVKPTTVYHMPVYSPTYGYMPEPATGLYSSMTMGSDKAANHDYYRGKQKQTYSESSSSPLGTINFTDYDDEFGNYYLRKSSNSNKRKLYHYDTVKRIGLESKITWLMPTDEEEALDNDDSGKKRVKRQVYHESSYENEPPCYGFPLEINIKSRIKMDQLFPIQGKSQYKKCIKVGRPLLPPVEDDSPY